MQTAPPVSRSPSNGKSSQMTPLSDTLCISESSGDQRGFGVRAAAQLQQGDDEFEAYRKRMMIAYRFRPNPLVSLLVNLSKCSLLTIYVLRTIRAVITTERWADGAATACAAICGLWQDHGSRA